MTTPARHRRVHRLRALALTSLLAAAASTTARAGNFVGHSADDRPATEGTAWFLDERPVDYCLQVANDFGVDPLTLRTAVTGAIASWHDYLVSRTGRDSLWSRLRFVETPGAACHGGESLRFVFGQMDDEIAAARVTMGLLDPLGFAYRESFDPAKRRGKGFIWLAPPASVRPELGFPRWTTPDVLHAVLVHELGHVLGCDHTDGTIMRADIVQLLADRSANGEPDARLRRIDHEQVLISCLDCDVAYSGFLGASHSVAESVRNFTLLTGHQPVGDVTATLRMRDASISPAGPSLTVTDGALTETLPIRITAIASSVLKDSSILQTAYLVHEQLEVHRWPTRGLVLVTQTTTATGRALTLLMTVNGLRSPLALSLLDPATGAVRDLFDVTAPLDAR